MATKEKRPRSTSGSGDGPQHTCKQAPMQPTASRRQTAGAPTATNGADTRPPPGLDRACHAAAQRAAKGADTLYERLFPTLMADALGYDKLFDGAAYKVYLERLIGEARPADPIEKMMLEQLALAHFRIGQLHVSAAHAKAVEGVKIYTGAAARLWGEFRRTALALRVYRTRIPEDKPAARVKLYKMAE